jgi:peptidase M50-like protein
MDEKLKRRLIQLGLVVFTFICTTLSGAEWIHGWWFLYVPNPLGWDAFIDGMQYSIPFLLILTVHEFGHYFTARYHKVKVSLPYYIPAWLGFLGSMSLGTMGAFIRIRERISSVSKTFDIGIAGPLAGFVAALIVLLYGFTHLPPKEYVYSIHPEYQLFGDNYENIVYSKDTFYLKSDLAKIAPIHAKRFQKDTIYMNQEGDFGFQIGTSLLFDYMKYNWVPEEHLDRLPNDHELMHYPILLAGFLALMFTALNLLPIGQLDGGHVVFGMFGAQIHSLVSRGFYLIAIVYSGLGVGFLGFVNPFILNRPISDLMIDLLLYVGIIYFLLQRVFDKRQTQLMFALGVFVLQMAILYLFPGTKGYSGWFLFILIVGRFIRVQHPTTLINEPITSTRQVLGWIAIIIFIISFSLKPMIIG